MKLQKLLALLTALLLLAACGQSPEDTTENSGNTEEIRKEEQTPSRPAQPVDKPEETPEPEPVPEPEPENITLTFTAVGDNLIHNTLSFDSAVEGGYDFRPIYAGVADRIAGSDIALLTQEVPLNDVVGAYPMLGAPKAVAEAIAEVGFNVASLANNHLADQGVDGARQTIETLEANGITVIGARDDQSEIGSYVILEEQGVKIGLLAYTYGLNNGLSGQGWMVDITDRDRIAADVQALRPQCDFLAVAMHWGAEYQQQPGKGQQEYAQMMADLGVDLIIGSHPHVMQPAQWIDRGEGEEQTLCIYSLGNFVSGQREQDRLIGGILRLELEFTPEGEFIAFKTAEIDGAVTHYNPGNKGFALYLLEDYTEELAVNHGLHNYDLPVTLGFLQERMAGIKESLKR